MEHGFPIITLLGSLSIRRGDSGGRASLSGSAGDVFAYLVTHSGHNVRRERLADLFWTDADPARARAALNTAVWRINKALADFDGIVLRSGGEHVALETCPGTWIDARELELAVRAAGSSADGAALEPALRNRLAEAVEHCRGPFLDGSASDWAIVERERLHALELRGLGLLMRDSAQACDFEDALSYGSRILTADPFREQVQYEMMWLYVLNGQRPQALRQFEAYRRLIAREMGVAPMVETQALMEYVRNGPAPEIDVSELRRLMASKDPLTALREASVRSRLAAWSAFSPPASRARAQGV